MFNVVIHDAHQLVMTPKSADHQCYKKFVSNFGGMSPLVNEMVPLRQTNSRRT